MCKPDLTNDIWMNKCVMSAGNFNKSMLAKNLYHFSWFWQNLTLLCPGTGGAVVKISHSNLRPGSKELYVEIWIRNTSVMVLSSGTDKQPCSKPKGCPGIFWTPVSDLDTLKFLLVQWDE